MTVMDNGKVVATYPMSGGRPKYPTMNGTHIVMDREPVVHMVSSTVGIPVNSADGYDELVYNDVHISDSGEYVHAAPWSVGDQGHVNVSHGCINLSSSNALDFYTLQSRRRRGASGGWASPAGSRRSRCHGLGHRLVAVDSRHRPPLAERSSGSPPPPTFGSERELVEDGALDLAEMVTLHDLAAVGGAHVKRVDDLVAHGRDLRAPDVEVEIGERACDAVEHADPIGCAHLDHGRGARRLVVDSYRRGSPEQLAPYRAPVGAASLGEPRVDRQLSS